LTSLVDMIVGGCRSKKHRMAKYYHDKDREGAAKRKVLISAWPITEVADGHGAIIPFLPLFVFNRHPCIYGGIMRSGASISPCRRINPS
jgi:hypothetical protein